MAEAKSGRRHLRLTITEDMQDLWAWFQDVRPRAAAREVEFLLRLGVLSAMGPRTVPSQAGHRAGPEVAAVGAAFAVARAGAGSAPAAPVAGQAEDEVQGGEEPVRARALGFNHAEALQM